MIRTSLGSLVRVLAGAALLLALAAQAGAQCGGPNAGDCFQPGSTPSCANQACCQSVCAIDPFCCATAWDELCVGQAFVSCLGCGAPDAGSCFAAPHPPACDDAICCQLVCTADPFCCTSQWDSACRAAAEAGCAQGGCGGSVSCWEIHATPGCASVECCETVCAADPFCCETEWDIYCVVGTIELCSTCGQSSAGGCFALHATPGCDQLECCALVCLVDPYCCEVEWDDYCVLAAAIDCLGCGDPGAGSCFAPHSLPGCGDPFCCATVCVADPFCCQITWDADCVSAAGAGCKPFPSICGDPVAGECFIQHGTPFCDHAGCCATVCSIDPFCCEAYWDETCVAQAISECSLACGSPVAGSCFDARIEPYCEQAECCDAVCSADPYCCSVMWDASCASGAFAFCLGCGDPSAGSCYFQHSWPSCADPLCCEAVCGLDPYCCLAQWDLPCQLAAFELCLGCGASGTGSCLGRRDAPSCDLAACCGEVCRYDLFCCTVAWDAACVAQASLLCVFPQCYGGCPGDFTADAKVDATDLAVLLGSWGGAGCGDVDGDALVGPSDLAILLGGWGACP